MESPPITLDDMKKWDEILERPSLEEMALIDCGTSELSPARQFD
jgi:hypothetical protein